MKRAYGTSQDQLEAREARERMEAADRAWLRRLSRCNCPRPLRARLYGKFWSCALCGKLMGAAELAKAKALEVARRARGARTEKVYNHARRN